MPADGMTSRARSLACVNLLAAPGIAGGLRSFDAAKGPDIRSHPPDLTGGQGARRHPGLRNTFVDDAKQRLIVGSVRQASPRQDGALPALALRSVTIGALRSEKALTLDQVFESRLGLRPRFRSLGGNQPPGEQEASKNFQATAHFGATIAQLDQKIQQRVA